MFSRKYWLCLGCLLMCLSMLNAATLQETAWQAAYEGELHCDPMATRNALVRLKDYHRFNLIPLTKEQEKTIDQALAQIILPKLVKPAFDTAVAPTESIKTPKRKKWEKPYVEKSKKPVINKDRLETDLLRKAENAYRAGRLEESQRFFQWALQLKPTSVVAKKGLEKIAAEMK